MPSVYSNGSLGEVNLLLDMNARHSYFFLANCMQSKKLSGVRGGAPCDESPTNADLSLVNITDPGELVGLSPFADGGYTGNSSLMVGYQYVLNQNDGQLNGFDEFQGIYTLDQSYWLYKSEPHSGALSLFPNNTWMRTAAGEDPNGHTKWLIDL